MKLVRNFSLIAFPHLGSSAYIGGSILCALFASAVMFAAAAGGGPVRDGDAPDWQPQKPEFLEIARRLRESENEILGHAQVERMRRQLESPHLDMANRAQGQVLLSVELLRIDKVEEAVELIEQARSTIEADPRLQPLTFGLHLIRGLVYLRQAEVENCIRRHNADCCIFPLAGGGIHEVRPPARNAFESYLEALRMRPNDLRLRWLLNLVAMALGEHPELVPEPFRIDPAVFESEYDMPRFRDVAPDLGLDAFNLCGGAAAEDFTGDGLIDIVTSTFDPEGPLLLFTNRGDGGFDDRSDESRLSDQLGGLNLIAADVDNGGRKDILVLRGAWLFDEGRIRNSLLRNNGDGTFTDITRAAGLADPPRPTQAATWGDFNNNGLLDLYIGNESRIEREAGRGDYPSQLFRNDGVKDGIVRFTDIAEEAGVANDRLAKGVAAGDYNNNGHLDLYVSNIGRNRLYRNNGDGTFTDVAPELGLTEPDDRSFACWFFDYNNTGWLDVFVGAYDAKIEDVAAGYLGRFHSASVPRLYRNDGDGTFTDVAQEVGLARPFLPMGANFGDIDNDGWLDIYLATGDPDFQTLMPNVLLRNDRGERFQDVTTAAGLGHLQKGHGVAFADFNQNGRQDLYHQLGGFFPGDRFRNALFVNPGAAAGLRGENAWLIVRLIGTESNRSAFGARLTVRVQTPDGEREIHRAVGSVSSFGGSPLRQEIGLGDAEKVAELSIWWPRSDRRQTLRDVPLNAAIEVREDAETFTRLPYEPFEYGGR